MTVPGAVAAGGVLLALSALACAAWTSGRMDPAHVMVSKNEPPPFCTPLGTVEAPMNEDYKRLRIRASSRDANYVVIDVAESQSHGFSSRTMLTGRAFWCPPVPPPYFAMPMPIPAGGQVSPDAPQPAPFSPQAPVPQTASSQPSQGHTCAPDCAPGYACVAGECVAVCAPECPPDQRCGADRVCRPRQ